MTSRHNNEQVCYNFQRRHILNFSGATVYLSTEHNIAVSSDQYWYCTVAITLFFISSMCSTLFIISMTFARCYGIIMPHKAASFNTMKRTKVTIVCVIIFSVLYNSPHMVTSSNQDWQCLPYGEESVMSKKYGTLYYWLSFIIHYALPFVLLLSMNCVIIHTIRSSAKFRTKLDPVPEKNSHGQGQSQGQIAKTKSSENQVYIVLLLVAFGFLILTTPGYLLFLFIMVVDFTTSPKVYAGFYLFFNVAQKLHYTNHGINFFLYVMSGQKFRRDLIKLFNVKDSHHKEMNSGDTVISTVCDSKTTKVT